MLHKQRQKKKKENTMMFARQINGLPYNFHTSHSRWVHRVQAEEQRSSNAETATAFAAWTPDIIMMANFDSSDLIKLNKAP